MINLSNNKDYAAFFEVRLNYSGNTLRICNLLSISNRQAAPLKDVALIRDV